MGETDWGENSHGPQPCLTQWNYEPCHVGPPKTDGSWWRVLTKCVPLEKGMANHFSSLALRTSWTVWKGKNIELPRSVGAQYATGDQRRNNSRKNEEMEPKEKQHPAAMWLMMEARSDAVKSIGTWNVKSMNQGKLEVVKHEMARVNQQTKMDRNGWI